MVRVLDHDFRIFIALHIIDGVKKIKTTQWVQSVMEKIAVEITDVRQPMVHNIVTDDDIVEATDFMLTQYLGLLISDYKKQYASKSWFERLIMWKYFRDYKRRTEEFKAAKEALCLNQIKIWQ